MNRYRSYFPRDDPPLADADGGFLGVNMRLSPGQLPAGTAAGAVNMRFENGVARPRKGLHKPAWGNQVVVTSSQTNPALTSLLTKFDGVLGAGVYLDSEGRDWLIVMDLEGCWKERPFTGPSRVKMPTGYRFTRPVRFTQCLASLLLFQGTEAPTLELTDLDEGFKSIAKGDGTETLEKDADGNTIVMDDYDTDTGTAIPNATAGVFFGNRAIIPIEYDLVLVSDYLNYTRYAPVKNVFRINQGTQDKLVAAYPFGQTAMLFLKEHAAYVVTNLFGDLSTAQMEELTREYGCQAPRSVCAVGADVWWLSDRGVVGVAQTVQGKLQGIAKPLSEPIQPVIDRINWNYAANAIGAYWENRFYLAVPLDEGGPAPAIDRVSNIEHQVRGLIPGRRYFYKQSWDPATQMTADLELNYGTAASPMRLTAEGEFLARRDTAQVRLAGAGQSEWHGQIIPVDGVNTAMLVYDFLNGAWSGYDLAKNFYPQEFLQMKVHGRNRLLVLDAYGFVNLLEEGERDQVYDPEIAPAAVVEADISSMLLTRGYRCGDLGEKQFSRADLITREWFGQWAVSALVEGVEEERTLGTRTRSRVRYVRPWNKPDYNASNANNDAATPYREDYSVALEEVGAGSALAPEALHLYNAGVRVDEVQELTENFRPNLKGGYVQLRLTGLRGRTELTAVEVKALPGRRAGGTKG